MAAPVTISFFILHGMTVFFTSLWADHSYVLLARGATSVQHGERATSWPCTQHMYRLLGKTGDSSRGIEYKAGAVREQLAPSCRYVSTDLVQDLRVEARWHAHWRAVVLSTHLYQTSIHEYHLCMQAVSPASQRGGMYKAHKHM